MYPYNMEALERVKKWLQLPDATNRTEVSCYGEYFDPYEALFPHLYGSYSADFDVAAIESLREVYLVEHALHFDSLPHKMFKEMLCKQDLCDYGTSPRGCFAIQPFQEILPEVITRFEHYHKVYWSEK
jgi:hypothetical protein